MKIKCKTCIHNAYGDCGFDTKPKNNDCGYYHNDPYKIDEGKSRLDLTPPDIIEAIGAVRTYGVAKYGDDEGYKQVEPYRYRAALMRHLVKWLKNPHGIDEESGLPHIWHIACNVAFLVELDKP